MGLSIAITGCIVVFAMVYAMMSFPAIVDSTTKVSVSSAQMSNVLNSITHTNISIKNLVGTHDNNPDTFSVTNNGTTILWNYNKFDAIITYQADIVGNPTLTEVLQYASSCPSLAPDHWCIQSITDDLVHPWILDHGETANIQAKLQNNGTAGGILTLNFGTDNGILATDSVRIS